MYAIPETPECLPFVLLGFTGVAEFAQHTNLCSRTWQKNKLGNKGKGKERNNP